MKLDARGEGPRPQCPAGRPILAWQLKAAGRKRPEFRPLVAVVIAATGVFFRDPLIAWSPHCVAGLPGPLGVRAQPGTSGRATRHTCSPRRAGSAVAAQIVRGHDESSYVTGTQLPSPSPVPMYAAGPSFEWFPGGIAYVGGAEDGDGGLQSGVVVTGIQPAFLDFSERP
jgi:hypothetical protein